MSVHALMQQKTGYGFAGQPPLWVPDLDNGGWKSRSQYFGIFEDPNDLAQILAGTIPLIFAYPRRLSAVNLIIACGAAWVVIQALYSTGSRGGQVALFASIATMVMLKLPKKWLPYSIGVGLIGALVLCAVYGGSMMDASARERLEFWGLANQVFKHNPIFGIGYGMFWEVAGDRTAHSAFVYCYTELGIFGYWFWFSLLQLGLIGCYRTRMAFFRPRNEAEKYMKRLSGLCIASMVGFSAGAYFLSRAYTFPYFFLFGLLNAIPVIALRMLPEDRPPLIDTADDVYGRGTISTFISIVYIYVSILILNRFK
jgi:O-antigen ligase